MDYRTFGHTGLRVSQLFLGAMTFGGAKGTPLDECRRMLDLYADAGGNVVDTASMYGESEDVVGALLDGRRDRFVLATKFTGPRTQGDPNATGSHRKNLVLSLERSLKRLRTDYVDVLWVHYWDRHTPIDETLRALDDVVRAGKVLHIGISDAPAWGVSRANTIAELRGWTAFAGLQVPYNLLRRDIERELLPMAESYGMTLVTWRALGRGLLAGRGEHAATQALQQVAAGVGATPAQVAIAWTRARSPLIHPLIGASTVEQLRENLGAADLELPAEAVERLTAAVDFDIGFPTDFIGPTGPPRGEELTLGR